MGAKDVGLYHVENYTEEQYIGFIERAVSNPGSYEHASFYNFILNCFVEADAESKGRITYEQFHKLLDRAAVVPRHFGLAPDSIMSLFESRCSKIWSCRVEASP